MTRTLMACVALFVPVLAFAQEQPVPAATGTVTTGSFTVGGRQIDNDTNSAKFTEYRDLRDSGFLPALTLNLFDAGSGRFLDVSGSNISLDDQSIALRGGVAGRWSMRVDWNDIPHNFSNKAMTPYIRRGAGLFEVPETVPITFKKLATAAADAPGVVASDALIAGYQAAYLAPTDLATRNGFGHISFDYGRAEALSVGVSYDRTTKSGLKLGAGPIGDRPPRTLNIQLTEPVDYRSQDATFSAEHVGRRYQLQFSYLFSDFANRVDTLTWENVYATVVDGAMFDRWDRAVSTYGVRPLAPDNRYHNASFSIAGDLPADSRLSATVAYGRMEQNEPLLPYSYHVDLLVNRSLPRATADAEIATAQLLVDYVVNPMDRLNLRAWARYYGLDNNTPEDQWQYVTQDTSNLNGTVSYKNKRVNLAYASDRTNAGADATWRLRRGSLAVGFEHETVTRDYREANTGENRLTASFRTRPARWANLRARYHFGVRNGDYDPYVTSASYWYAPTDPGSDADNPAYTFSNHPDMVRDDVADRQRHQADLSLTLTPREVFSLSASVRYRKDDFDSSVTSARPLARTGVGEVSAATPGDQLGRLDDRRVRYALDAFYVASPRLSVNAFLSVDDGASLQRSLEFNENNKMNPSVIASAELGPWTRAGSQWTADTDDRTWTAGFGTTIELVPSRASLGATYTMSLGEVDVTYGGFGVTNWNGAPFAPNHQFAFTTPPPVEQDLHSLDLRVDVPLGRGVVFQVGYVYERFRLEDWQQGSDFGWVEGVGSEFLLRDTSRSHQWGNRLFNMGTYLAPSFDAHMAFATVSYRF